MRRGWRSCGGLGATDARRKAEQAEAERRAERGAERWRIPHGDPMPDPVPGKEEESLTVGACVIAVGAGVVVVLIAPESIPWIVGGLVAGAACEASAAPGLGPPATQPAAPPSSGSGLLPPDPEPYWP